MRANPAGSPSPTGTSWLRRQFRPEHINQAAGKAPSDEDLGAIDFKVQPVQICCRTIKLHSGLPLPVVLSGHWRLMHREHKRSDYSENPEKLAKDHCKFLRYPDSRLRERFPQ